MRRCMYLRLASSDFLYNVSAPQQSAQVRTFALSVQAMHSGRYHAQSGAATFSRCSYTVTEPSIDPELCRLAGNEDMPIFPRCEGACEDLVNAWCRIKREWYKIADGWVYTDMHSQWVLVLNLQDRPAMVQLLNQINTEEWGSRKLVVRLVVYTSHGVFKEELLRIIRALPSLREIVLPDREGEYGILMVMASIIDETTTTNPFLRGFIFKDGFLFQMGNHVGSLASIGYTGNSTHHPFLSHLSGAR